MTRQECEQKIKGLLSEIVETYKQYNPSGAYLSMFYIDGVINAHNSDWDLPEKGKRGEDYDAPINFQCDVMEG